jgi:hypothetical protein
MLNGRSGRIGSAEMGAKPSATGRDPEKAFRGQLKSAVRKLERAVLDLLENFWEEPLRRHAHEVSTALLDACKNYGYLELASVIRAISSLVALPMEEVLALEDALRAKLTELVGLLKEMADLVAA